MKPNGAVVGASGWLRPPQQFPPRTPCATAWVFRNPAGSSAMSCTCPTAMNSWPAPASHSLASSFASTRPPPAWPQLDAGDRNGRISEAFEAEHRIDPGLDVAMILLDQVVQVLRLSQRRFLGQQLVRLHFAHRAVRRRIAVQRDCLRSEPLTLDRPALAAATSRLALSRKSTVFPARSTAR